MWLLLALPHPRGLHRSDICLAATSSNVVESIRKICYYKSSTPGVSGVNIPCYETNMPFTPSFWPLDSLSYSPRKQHPDFRKHRTQRQEHFLLVDLGFMRPQFTPSSLAFLVPTYSG